MKILSTLKDSIYSCRKCGLCCNKFTLKLPFVCPIKEVTGGFEHTSPRGKIILAQMLLEKKIAPSRKLAEVFYSCTLCGNCQFQCGSIDTNTGLPLVDTQKIIEAVRADLLHEFSDLIDQRYHSILTSTQQYQNPWGLPRTIKERWFRGLKFKDAQKESHETLLFIGCTIPSHPILVDKAHKIALILRKAGIDIGILGKNEPCCGSIQKKIGAIELAQKMERDNLLLFNNLGSTNIVTLCPGCYHQLKHYYQDERQILKPKVFHYVEFLYSLIKEGKLNFLKQKTLSVTYHDPCHLGRMMKIFDPPREILKALPGITFIEKKAIRENSICCGAGGGMRILGNGVLAEEIGKIALQIASKSKAEALVTACPFCELNLSASAKITESPMVIYDILDLVAEFIGIEEC